MASSWNNVGVGELRVGDRVRHRGSEFEIARIDQNFLGRSEMVCLIEDTPSRWHAYPAVLASEIERLEERP